ncbi:MULTISPECIES: DUF5302 domain-containing protein [unclassified Streptomyces]|uniref:DUF5302 domain-containing protein n=1 Tax=unclassified Streptomyces TaxID=2593676 RepID=UPI0024414B86|nr:DUF5302 domain-containing protein [Streptomyces sp. DH41]MDG9723692.1 DUF5302 domain-containing protein [Streptomyces sp. DH41]
MTEQPEQNAAETDARRKFRQALERKANNARSQRAHLESRLKIKGSGAANNSARRFRRKSG